MPLTTLDTKFTKDDECVVFFNGQLVRAIVRGITIRYSTPEAIAKERESFKEIDEDLAFLPPLNGDPEVICTVEIIHPLLNCPHPHHRYFEWDERLLYETPQDALIFIKHKFQQVYDQLIGKI